MRLNRFLTPIALIIVILAILPAYLDLKHLLIIPGKLRIYMSSLPLFNRVINPLGVIRSPIEKNKRAQRYRPELDLAKLKDEHFLEGKVALVTGGNSGIGLETVKVLAAAGAEVIFTSRSIEKGDEVIKQLTKEIVEDRTASNPSTCSAPVLSTVPLDLASLSSVYRSIDFIKNASGSKQIDFLILNAGKFLQSEQETNDGFEWMFGAHHVGHFALFKFLLENNLLAKNARIVITSSALLLAAETLDWNSLKGARSGLSAKMLYGQSKLANALFARELHARYGKGLGSQYEFVVTVNHPGLVRTNILGENSICTWLTGLCFEPQDGALANLVGCVGDPKAIAGKFLFPGGSIANWNDLSDSANDVALSRKLWEWTEKELEQLDFETGA